MTPTVRRFALLRSPILLIALLSCVLGLAGACASGGDEVSSAPEVVEEKKQSLTLESSTSFPGPTATSFQTVVGDYDCNGTDDIIRREVSTGRWTFLTLSGGSLVQTKAFTWSQAVGAHYQPVVGNFDRTRCLDIGVRDPNNGTWYFLFDNGAGGFGAQRSFTWVPGAHYQTLVGDFDGVNGVDIGLRDSHSGRWHFAFFNGVDYYHHTRNFDWVVGNYQPLVADFSGDGKADIALRNADTGVWYISYFNGADHYHQMRVFSWSSGATWEPSVGDFNNDRVLDVLLRNRSTGRLYIAYAPVPKTEIGIFYSLWHCNKHPYDNTEAIAGRQAWGPVPAFHWWSKPALGYYCLTNDRHVLRQHATMLRAAGIDFVYLDITNWKDDDAAGQNDILQPLRAMVEEWRQLDAPQIVPWGPGDGTMLPAVNALLSQSANQRLRFHYQGKPLLFTDPDSVSRYQSNYTVRVLGARLGPQSPDWSWIQACADVRAFKVSGGTSPCEQRVTMRNGVVEQVPIAAGVHLLWMSNPDEAISKYSGRTFVRQFETLMQHSEAPIALITSWNEWIAQRYCLDVNGTPFGAPGFISCVTESPPGYPERRLFVDLYDRDYSRDMEPSVIEGDHYYRLLSSCVRMYKRGEYCSEWNKTRELCCQL